MSNKDVYLRRKKDIANKLSKVILVQGEETRTLWEVAFELKISGTTVKNYLQGKIGCGYMAEAILEEFKKRNLVK